MGYIGALALILSKFHQDIQGDNLLQIVQKECNVSNCIKKSEHTHFLTGHLLIMLEVVRTRMLDQQSTVLPTFYELLFTVMHNHPWTSQ